MKRKPTPLKIIQELYSHRKEVLKNITQESVDVYLWLKNEYKKGNIKDNHVFQFIFRCYYRLDNAGLSNDQKERYFELMARKQIDLEIILRELYEIPTLRKKKSIQFSFATKLLHTVDNSKPIFDAEVSAVIHKRVTGNNKEEKITSAKGIYAYLEEIYLIFIENEKINGVIKDFRARFDVNEKVITDQKILDFLIWSLGKFKV